MTPAFGKRKKAVQQVREEKDVFGSCNVISSVASKGARNMRQEREEVQVFNDYQKATSFQMNKGKRDSNGWLVDAYQVLFIL